MKKSFKNELIKEINDKSEKFKADIDSYLKKNNSNYSILNDTTLLDDSK